MAMTPHWAYWFVPLVAAVASRLARSDEQRTLAVWLASLDRRVWGSLAEGRDVGTLPWVDARIDEQKAFLQEIVDAGRSRVCWDLFMAPGDEEDFRPLLRPLGTLGQLVAQFSPQHACRDEAIVWGYNGGRAPATFERCHKHPVYLHANGCLWCNDGDLSECYEQVVVQRD
ncbi:hypothetical protein AAW51_4684 [Caldimonas brevitalea]|uniref:Uncharacterized protein n=1 Tax=Caldimonas brevitalea TaxID=413882 RepID=A0A0G3BXX8_9BURK|nr:hypothetical protein AAW51_4684 [Caldimonas brevitalea]